MKYGQDLGPSTSTNTLNFTDLMKRHQKKYADGLWRTSSNTVWVNWVHLVSTCVPLLKSLLRFLTRLVLMSWLTDVHVNNIYLCIYIYIFTLCSAYLKRTTVHCQDRHTCRFVLDHCGSPCRTINKWRCTRDGTNSSFATDELKKRRRRGLSAVSPLLIGSSLFKLKVSGARKKKKKSRQAGDGFRTLVIGWWSCHACWALLPSQRLPVLCQRCNSPTLQGNNRKKNPKNELSCVWEGRVTQIPAGFLLPHLVALPFTPLAPPSFSLLAPPTDSLFLINRTDAGTPFLAFVTSLSWFPPV